MPKLICDFPALESYTDGYSENYRFFTTDRRRFLYEVETMESQSVVIENGLRRFLKAAGDIPVTEGNRSCETGLAASFNGELYYPVRASAIESILDTAQLSGRVLEKLSSEELAQMIDTALRHQNGDTLMLIRGGKCSCILSNGNEGYELMPISSLIATLEKTLQVTRGDSEFVKGFNSNEITRAEYLLYGDTADKIASLYAGALKNDSLRVTGTGLSPLVLFQSSDTRMSSASLTPCLQSPKGTAIPVADTLRAGHLRARKGNGMEGFEENCAQLFAKFEDLAILFEQMSDVILRHPEDAFVAISKRIGLPKRYASLALEEMQGMLKASGMTTMLMSDLYLYLAETLSYAKAYGISDQLYIKLEDKIARILKLNWKAFDLARCSW